ncbi:uncharacterized protein LY89DRAFT_735829 [Mollisia scopiformis]|uniref:Cbs domain-containing protein n=1 Tax=Mollisia scopiformis TaxID=149040 RepID=A0A194X4K2_MOLSC|nr:uncharacterized protein LY89DRAFT_735829 [Mollisia scopiformis]KUJ14752.1 hypothetical protein LY89DRAFT_735829 [Mollisia scopiformis]
MRSRSIKGTRSLATTALAAILTRIDELSVDLLMDMPAVLLQGIWQEIKNRQLVSFHVWRVFSVLLKKDDATLRILRHRDQITKPKSPLRFYTTPLTSESFEFLTYLSITTTFAIPELVKLSAVKNLVALEIVSKDKNSEHCVSDRVIRAWSFAANSEGAFQVLRILKLWKHLNVTNVSLAYLNSFPSLAVFDVTGCGFDLTASVKARDFGWKPTIDPNLLGQFEAACVERAVVMRAALGKEPLPSRKASAQQLGLDALVSRLPRADVPGFLSRDETTIRPQSPKDPTALDTHERKDPSMSGKTQAVDVSQKDKPKLNRSIPVWDFPVYTKINRIGELRNDGDLQRAGIEIGDQPVVENDLICPIPIVSFRIGPTPACLVYTMKDSAQRAPNKSTYSIVEPLQESVHTWKECPPKGGARQAQRLAFTRIKYDVTEVLPSSINQEVPSARDTGTTQAHLKRPSIAGSRPTTSGGSAPAKRRPIGRFGLERKRKSLGDVLGSFLS